jgi:iron-sulfur cluster assembly accessory protein
MTDAAVNKVSSLLMEKNLPDHGLRVFISDGGCSGMQYGMAFTTETTENDHIIDINGVRLIVDSMSIQYLKGAEIDYVDDLVNGGFRIANPNATATCGCGHSFSV